ncbi:hypothetical protein Bca52824_037523 [Brassica carinata]|uniref:HP domain-containing protein n=1 Tax=Brassica carinata TaxID=52824 RepID=A0A8X7RKS6_BRACI|nr:hypothetical protein Bca52824_037523 [Brassica carinata]
MKSTGKSPSPPECLQSPPGVDDAIDKSKKVLTTKSRRMTRNKWIVGSGILALILAIIFDHLIQASPKIPESQAPESSSKGKEEKKENDKEGEKSMSSKIVSLTIQEDAKEGVEDEEDLPAYPYERLETTSPDPVTDIDVTRREAYLSSEEFKEKFVLASSAPYNGQSCWVSLCPRWTGSSSLSEEHNISSSSATTALAPLLWKTLNGGKCRGFFSVGMVMPYTCLKSTDQSTYRKEEEWKNVAALP